MKAASIEQIREHLARGGRVVSHRGDTALSVDLDGKIRYESPASFTWRAVFNQGDWELVPIEPLPGVDVRTLPILTEDPTGESRDFSDLPGKLGRAAGESISRDFKAAQRLAEAIELLESVVDPLKDLISEYHDDKDMDLLKRIESWLDKNKSR